jgi:putative DNA primase/helicase
LKFLARVTDGDRALQDYMQRMLGYALTGLTIEHALFFLYGTGANGKSVLMSIVAGILGTARWSDSFHHHDFSFG